MILVGLQDLYLQLDISNSSFEMISDQIASGIDPSASNYIVSSSYNRGNLVREGSPVVTTISSIVDPIGTQSQASNVGQGQQSTTSTSSTSTASSASTSSSTTSTTSGSTGSTGSAGSSTPSSGGGYGGGY